MPCISEQSGKKEQTEMGLKEKTLNAIQSASSRGLRQVSALFVLGASVLLTGLVFISFEYTTTKTSLSTTFKLRPESELPSLSAEMSVEKAMIRKIHGGQSPLPDTWTVLPGTEDQAAVLNM